MEIYSLCTLQPRVLKSPKVTHFVCSEGLTSVFYKLCSKTILKVFSIDERESFREEVIFRYDGFAQEYNRAIVSVCTHDNLGGVELPRGVQLGWLGFQEFTVINVY